MIKVALTHDVDRVKKTYQYITHSLKALNKSDIVSFTYHLKSLFYKNPYWNFDRIIKIENEYNVKSTFFFLDESIKFNHFDIDNWKLSLGRYNMSEKKVTRIVKYLDKNGWEIGLHGSYNSYKNKELLQQEKAKLEHIIGHKVKGIRQHYLNLEESTFKIQQECGFEYDTTIYHKKHKSFEFYRTVIKEFPMHIMDCDFMVMDNKWGYFDKILEYCSTHNEILVINWHQRVFNELEFPLYKETYCKIIELLNVNKAKFVLLGNCI